MQSEVEVALSSSSTTGAKEQRVRVEAAPGSAMKKYTKLVLALVAVISSLAFLIYKYRYDRLYHVMQVSGKDIRSIHSLFLSLTLLRPTSPYGHLKASSFLSIC